MIAVDQIRQCFDSLSPRQGEIALLLAEGFTNTMIAGRLGMTVHTVKAHRAEVMLRMQAASFADLVSKLQKIQPTLSPTTNTLHILVVEDDPWYRDYLVENLLLRNFTVVGVASGEDFTVAWAGQSADIVILDIELGSNEEDGLAIATRLQARSSCGIIMVTASGELDDRIKGLKIGADAYFSKPVSIDELALTIANLARRFR